MDFINAKVIMRNKLLFICTGNYYRSRFAEILFNSLVATKKLNWEATSRGTAVKADATNVGAIAKETIEGLKERGIEIGGTNRFPLQIQEEDLATTDLIIAVQEAEHRPYLEARFPNWLEKIEYWHVQDIDFVSADEALSQIEREVDALIQRIVTNI